MTVKVLFFGQLKDIAGRTEDRLELPEGVRLDFVFRHYASLFHRLAARHGVIEHEPWELGV